MSALAKLMAKSGYRIQGSDIAHTDIDYGIKFILGQNKSNLDGVDVFVYGSAINQDNPEFVAAKDRGIYMIHRSDMLSFMMSDKYGIVISGTHGKTTTTAIVSHLLLNSGLPCASLVGGVVKGVGSNFMQTSDALKDYVVVEGDESDRSFLKFPRKISVVTNISMDHMENYDYDEEVLFQKFADFINGTNREGVSILCFDDINLRKITDKFSHPGVLWYSIENENTDFFAKNISYDEKGSFFDIVINKTRCIQNVFLPLHGSHNVLNALSAVAVADYLNISEDYIRQHLSSFPGVKRRFDIIGKINQATAVDDYAHHPREIKATIMAAKRVLKKEGRIVVVFQPHRYSRVKNLLDEFGRAFNDADEVIVLPIYSAFENPDHYGVSDIHVFEKITINKPNHSCFILDFANVREKLFDLRINESDMILFLGAGDVTFKARSIVDQD